MGQTWRLFPIPPFYSSTGDKRGIDFDVGYELLLKVDGGMSENKSRALAGTGSQWRQSRTAVMDSWFLVLIISLVVFFWMDSELLKVFVWDAKKDRVAEVQPWRNKGNKFFSSCIDVYNMGIKCEDQTKHQGWSLMSWLERVIAVMREDWSWWGVPTNVASVLEPISRRMFWSIHACIPSRRYVFI